jgi:hypothetical protein
MRPWDIASAQEKKKGEKAKTSMNISPIILQRNIDIYDEAKAESILLAGQRTEFYSGDK